MKKILILLLLLGTVTSQGQNIFEELQQNDPTSGKISIHQDKNIEILVLARINEIKNEQMIDGFRINIFSDDSRNSKEKAMSVRSGFMSKYKYYCEYVYMAPDSKLYVGNFRTKSEAMKALNIIKHDYPNSFIISGKIYLPDLDQ